MHDASGKRGLLWPPEHDQINTTQIKLNWPSDGTVEMT